jgi:hypothetical protein
VNENGIEVADAVATVQVNVETNLIEIARLGLQACGSFGELETRTSFFDVQSAFSAQLFNMQPSRLWNAEIPFKNGENICFPSFGGERWKKYSGEMGCKAVSPLDRRCLMCLPFYSICSAEIR